MPRFRLRIELVPAPLWGVNLRSNMIGLGPYRWLKLSRAIRTELGCCSICGGRKRLHGHEVWQFNEKIRSGVATLVKVDAICTLCHSVQHWGRTKILIMQGLMTVADGQRLIRHFAKVNGCSISSFDRHAQRASAQWRSSSKKKWKVDWGVFKSAVDEAANFRARRQAKLKSAL